MDLYSEIMNIEVDTKKIVPREVSSVGHHAYKEGHRDARHSAAELSLKAEARIEELESLLWSVVNDSGFRNLDESMQQMIMEELA